LEKIHRKIISLATARRRAALSTTPGGGNAMAMNRVQFQPGLSMPEFFQQFGTEAQC
jgi:hypothetical protein